MCLPSDIKLGDFLLYAVIFLFLFLPCLYSKANVIVYYGKYIVYSLCTILLAFGSIPFFALNAKSVKNCLYVSKIGKHLTHIIGIRWELRDLEHLSEDRGAIIVANHQSIFDILGMYSYWHIMQKCMAVAKKELFYFWPFGLAAWLGGVIFIDRSSSSQSYKLLFNTAQIMHEEKTKMLFFPEGTRNSKANRTLELLPFKRGAFRLAISCQVPILPVIYSPYYFIDNATMHFGSGKIIVKGLPEIPTENLTENDIDSLMERTRDVMREAFDELSREIVTTLPETHFTRQAFLAKNKLAGAKVRYLVVRLAFYGILLVSSILCIPIFFLSPRNLKNSTFYARHIGKHTSLLYGIKWEIRGRNRLRRRGGAVIVANHQHELDIVGMFTVWPFIDRCAAVAKEELLWTPFGLAAWLAGVVFINRSKPQSARGRINKTSKILENDTKIFMFPEGTRNTRIRETKQFLPFKKGAFRIAIQAQVPIIPVVFSPYYFVDDKEKILYPGGKVIISVLPPVPTSGVQMANMENLIESVRDQMQREYINLDGEITDYNDNT